MRSLPFAVGSYISIGTTMAMFAGGVVRWLAEQGQGKATGAESEVSPGSLYASGLIAAGGVFGLLAIIINLLQDPELSKHIPHWLARAMHLPWRADLFSAWGAKHYAESGAGAMVRGAAVRRAGRDLVFFSAEEIESVVASRSAEYELEERSLDSAAGDPANETENRPVARLGMTFLCDS